MSAAITQTTPVTDLFGVGAERCAQLARLNISTIHDLLIHRPRRYEDRRQSRTIADLAAGDTATVRGRVVAMGVKRFRHGSRSVFELILDDGTARLHCRWWNLEFMQRYFKQGDDVFAYGRVTDKKPRAMDHPETEVVEPGEDGSIHINRIVPIYPLTEGLPQRWLRSLMWRTLLLASKEDQGTRERAPEAVSREIAWPDLPDRREAFRLVHFPETTEDPERARTRLALDEFFEFQCSLRRRRQNLYAHAPGLPCRGDNRLIKPFLKELGFRLTDAQTNVLRELREELGGEHPMRRLLQGDVGSGKTVVAACSALMAIESGFNVILMVPTEILAAQHLQTFERWFRPLGVEVGLWTAHRKDGNAARQATLTLETARVAQQIIIGTHALFTEQFEVERLGLVIIDEQHKFGVSQRELLLRKGAYPHLLVMTATPIPRTLGLTVYGDLDISVIRELPKGRGRIRTFVRSPATLPKVWEFLREKLGEGRQVYVVYPRVEESGEGGTKAVLGEVRRLQEILQPYTVGMVHGGLKADEKERVMRTFRAGALQVLVATSVVEVGVDVPNATVMLIENADRFGLAQLHQLRGRIGRGSHESHCILVAEARSATARERLRVLEDSQDGFVIAEADLRLRGAGELLGQEQSGKGSFRFGDLVRDLALVQQARAEAANF